MVDKTPDNPDDKNYKITHLNGGRYGDGTYHLFDIEELAFSDITKSIKDTYLLIKDN